MKKTSTVKKGTLTKTSNLVNLALREKISRRLDSEKKRIVAEAFADIMDDDDADDGDDFDDDDEESAGLEDEDYPLDEARQLTVPEKHQLKVAYQTLKYNDAMAKVMGGMSKDEARAIIKKLTGKTPKETKESVDNSIQIDDPKKGVILPYVQFMKMIGRKVEDRYPANKMKVHIFKNSAGGKWKYAGSNDEGKILYDTTWNLTPLQVSKLGLQESVIAEAKTTLEKVPNTGKAALYAVKNERGVIIGFLEKYPDTPGEENPWKAFGKVVRNGKTILDHYKFKAFYDEDGGQKAAIAQVVRWDKGLKEDRASGLPPVVNDYLGYLQKVRDSKDIHTKIKNRKAAIRTLESMTAKAADLAVAEAEKLGLSKYAVGM